MGRRKGSKNKPKEGQDVVQIREAPARDGRANDVNGISILDLTETVKVREVPTIKYSSEASRTKGVEKRISSLVSRHKSFFLETDVLIEQTEYFVDSGGWTFAKKDDTYGILICHVKNLLKFLGGSYPVGEQKRSYQRHQVRRGIKLG
jgi:hypothetical protein|tara:strand:- start:169 stop:612 length:444 start_codon:yes stop_codon:yes gene_type:complete